MATRVAGMDVPESLIERIKGVDKKQRREEGIKIAVESIQRLRDVEGVHGVHIMAIEWEEAVPEIVKRANLHPRH
jgi:methylenetetrahydrofolate reductase (NADPH)